ncbi:histone deacetylase [Babesia caballi]|uniref:Histone deacetylase n=1 Tax=Babesia caballi TaxID=5871 RepID=A0AAV4LY95_BABCB|nr:histone deacetylase [Babesia caballi]
MENRESTAARCVKTRSGEGIHYYETTVRILPPGRRTPAVIHKCVLRGDYDTLKRILASKKREVLNDCDNFGRTAFHIALQIADPKALYLLLFYPLIHPSKLFATQDWLHLLGVKLCQRSEGADAENGLDENEVTYRLDVDILGDLQPVVKSAQRRNSGGPKRRRTAKFGIVSNGIPRNVQKTDAFRKYNGSSAKKAGSARNIGISLLRHWEKSPVCYDRSVLGLEHGSNMFGSNSRDVEALYEEHYKFVIGEPHNLERAVRIYSGKYPKLYANHPANMLSVAKLLEEDQRNVRTKIATVVCPETKRKSTTITTYRAGVAGEVNTPSTASGLSSSGKIATQNVGEATEAGVARSGVKGGGAEDQAKVAGEKRRRSLTTMRQMLSDSITKRKELRIPLTMCDLSSTYDKTAPIHLLFSNILVEHYRENIYKCFRVLMHYFNTFSDYVEDFISFEDMLCGIYPPVKGEEEPISTPMDVPTLVHPILLDPSIVPGSDAAQRGSQGYSIISCGLPNSSRTPILGTSRNESSDSTPMRLRMDSKTSSHLDISRIEAQLNAINSENEYRQLAYSLGVQGELPCMASPSHLGTAGLLRERWGDSPTSLRSNSRLPSHRETVDAVVTIDVVDGGVSADGRLSIPSVPCSGNPSASDVMENMEVHGSVGDRAASSIQPNQTFCAGLDNMNSEVLSCSIVSMGDRLDGAENGHDGFIEVPVRQARGAAVSRYLVRDPQDSKLQALSDAIVSSGLFRPTMAWEEFVNERDYTRSNLLHKACNVKDANLIKWLLACGCRPLVVNEVGDMPVHIAMDATDPMCVVTMVHATLEALFNHKLATEKSKLQANQDELFFPKEVSLARSKEPSAYEKFMRGLQRTQYTGRERPSRADPSPANARPHMEAPTKDDQVPNPFSDLGSSRDESVDSTVCESGELQGHQRVVMFEEMMKLIEQLTYRGIKAGAWDALIAMYSYNKTLSYHIMSSPHYMHRFINMAVLVGKSTEFMTVANFLATTFLKDDDVASFPHEGENGDGGARRKTHKSTPSGSGTASSERFSTMPTDTTRPASADVASEGYSGSGIPALALRRIFGRKSNTGGCASAAAGERSVEKESRKLAGSRMREYRSTLVNCLSVSCLAGQWYTEPPRDGAMDTWIITHPTCLHHLALPEPTDAPHKRHRLITTYPENPTRLEVIVSNDNGILRSDVLENVKLLHSPPPATLADVLRVHDYAYIEKLLTHVQVAQKKWLSNNQWPVSADGDTPATPHSWNSALYAAGSVLAAVDAVCKGYCRNAFCAVRPPGHHLGTWGGAQSAGFEDEDFAAGSQGFCLINNVAVGAAYAKYTYAKSGIRRIAIIDFDVHHGNGTHQIVANIGPRKVRCEQTSVSSNDPRVTQTAHSMWFGWRDTHDREDVFFSSIHAYDGVFYPGTGRSCSRYEPSEPRIINVGVPEGTTSAEFKVLFEGKILPYLMHFKPDLIFISAGFDGHYRDSVATGFVKYNEKDFFWATERLVAVANSICNGRVVSVLEGGYNTRLDTLSPFARSVLEHVRALNTTSEGYLYPFMHSPKTIDILLAPIIGTKIPLTINSEDAQTVVRVLSGLMHRSNLIRSTTDQLLRKVYSIDERQYCCAPAVSLVTPTHATRLEALAQTGNAFYSFYSRHFHTLFMTGSYVGSNDYLYTIFRDRSNTEHDVLTFDKLMGTESNVGIMGASLVSYSGNSVVASRLASTFNLHVGNATSEECVEQLLFSNSWSAEIKMKSLERHATSAALLLEFYKNFEHVFTWQCTMH